MKKRSPMWRLFGAGPMLVLATVSLLAGPSTRGDGAGRAAEPTSRTASRPGNSAQIPAAPLMIFTVTNTTGAGSLRTAIIQANSNPGLDVIDFNLGAGTPTINVVSVTGNPLPAISDPVMINGNTGGATRIELNGTAAGPSACLRRQSPLC